MPYRAREYSVGIKMTGSEGIWDKKRSKSLQNTLETVLSQLVSREKMLSKRSLTHILNMLIESQK